MNIKRTALSDKEHEYRITQARVIGSCMALVLEIKNHPELINTTDSSGMWILEKSKELIKRIDELETMAAGIITHR